MAKFWYNSSNVVNKSAKIIFALLVCFLLSPDAATAEEGATPASSASPVSAAVIAEIPELELKTVQKNETGTRYQLGDRIRLYVEISPELAKDAARFELSLPDGQSKLEEQGWYLDLQPLWVPNSFQFVVAPVKPGKLTLPTLLISPEGKSPIARTRAFSIEVIAPEPKKEPSALLDPIEISLASKYWVMLFIASLLVVALTVYLTRRYLKARSHEKPATLPVVKKDPEHVIALRELELLYKKNSYSRENLKIVAFGVSEILKHFFSERFRIDAAESTTDEMIALLRRESLSSDGLREILSLFQDLDLIKFTKTDDAHQFNEQHYLEFKVKAQSLIQKWANRAEVSPQ